MKRIISIILAAVMIAAAMPQALAKSLVTVSAWAYNDVSNFTSKGLLPDSFENVKDYTQPITRLQFAELVYSAVGSMRPDGYRTNRYFADTDSVAAAYLAYNLIMVGEGTGVGLYEIGGDPSDVFYPDRQLTREEMAAVIYRAVRKFCPDMFEAEDKGELLGKLSDHEAVSAWALDAVLELMRIGVISGMDDGSFEPKASLTIEQAIAVVYKLHNSLPAALKPDGADIHSSYETEIQTYSNGMVETKKNTVLYLRDGGKILMDFETDVYSNIYCESVNGIIYAAAQNIHGKTEVYNAVTKELIFTIPYPITGIDGEYIHTKSKNTGPMTFGLYDYSGRELLAPKYSLEEIEIIKENGHKVPVDEYQAPSGWIYFADQNDGGRLCRMDSNGENKQRLSDIENVCRIEYINGRIFFNAYSNKKEQLYCINTDGTGETRLSEMSASVNVSFDRYLRLVPADNSSTGYDMVDISNNGIYSYDEWVYYREYDNDAGISSLWRVNIMDNGIKKEKIFGDDNVFDISDVQVKNGRIYWRVNASENSDTGFKLSLYCFDGTEPKKLSGDMNVIDYGFYNDRLVMITGGMGNADTEGGADTTAYIADPDGSNLKVFTEIEQAKSRFVGTIDNTYGKSTFEFEQYSDDTFTVYMISEWGENVNKNTLCAADADGHEIVIAENAYIVYRIDNTVYYRMYYSENDNSIYSCDLNTGEQKTIADDVLWLSVKSITYGDDWFTYMDYSHNIWRYDAKLGTRSEIFPNSSMRRYGKVQKMLGLNDGMYKVDTDGNYALISTEYAANCLYVENGAKEGVHF